MIQRGQNFKELPIDIVGSSTYGRYPKVNASYTYNMFVSDGFLVDYAGYRIAVPSSQLGGSLLGLSFGRTGRAIFNSTKLGKLISVIDNRVYIVNIIFNQIGGAKQSYIYQPTLIGTLQTISGVVYITENNKPQLLISDNSNLYVYDPSLTPSFQVVPNLAFKPGYVTFHDTYFICAASEDTFYSPAANNTWRLSGQNDGLSWPNTSSNIGLLQTKPDNVKAVVRVPSQGNMIFVLGQNVCEPWFDTGAQLFPYQRNNQMNIDYGCLSPATVAYMDEMVVWLAVNEKSGPIIMYSNGGPPQKITTDGMDFLFHQLQNPEDSQGFLYRQDGHLFYHINFYKDNKSFFYDFNTSKFYNACDQNLNYFIAAQVAYFNHQYYFVTKNNGNIFSFDTTYTSYQDVDANNNIKLFEIPRIRTCKNLRLPQQEWFILNDAGFTIETGDTDYFHQTAGPINLITQDGKYLITQGNAIFIVTQDGKYIITQDNKNLVSQQLDNTDFNYLIMQQPLSLNSTPRVDLSISYDGGATFGNDFSYVLNPIGQRRNALRWWQLGAGNDIVLQFKFVSFGRVVCTNGIANIRQ